MRARPLERSCASASHDATAAAAGAGSGTVGSRIMHHNAQLKLVLPESTGAFSPFPPFSKIEALSSRPSAFVPMCVCALGFLSTAFIMLGLSRRRRRRDSLGDLRAVGLSGCVHHSVGSGSDAPPGLRVHRAAPTSDPVAACAHTRPEAGLDASSRGLICKQQASSFRAGDCGTRTPLSCCTCVPCSFTNSQIKLHADDSAPLDDARRR